MRALRRTLTLVVTLVPAAILVVTALFLVRRFYAHAERNLAPILQSEATRALGHEVRVGRVTLQGGYAYLDRVSVAEGKTLAERGALITARRVALDFSLAKLLAQRSPALPLFDRIQVFDPVARVSRRADRRWNFSDLIRPRPGPPQRVQIGEVQVSNGTLYYEDAAFPRNPRRPAAPFQAVAEHLNGSLLFHGDRAVTWAVAASGQGGWLRSAVLDGAYDPQARRLYLTVNARDAALATLTRLLPPDVELPAGAVSGRITLLRGPDTRSPFGWDVQGSVTLAGGVVRTTRVAEPILNVRGAATVANDLATVRADADFAGSPIHVEGTAADPKHLTLNGWMSGAGVHLQRMLTALRVQDRVPILRGVEATADVRAAVRGPLSNLAITASGPASVSGVAPGGATVPRAAGLDIAFTGPFDNPRVLVSGLVPTIRFRQYEARQVRISAVYTRGQASADFSGQVADGLVTGRAHIAPPAAHGRYEVVARARGVALDRLPLGLRARLAGRVQADVALRGTADSATPQGRASIQVSGLNYNGYTAREVTASLVGRGDYIYVEPLSVRDPAGFALASGRVDVRRRTLGLRLEADGVQLARLPIPERAGAAPAPAAPAAEHKRLEGVAFVRDGRITGSWDDPQVTGRVRAYSLGYGELTLDYVAGRVTANRREVAISGGRAYRFPASAAIDGVIRDPLSPRAQLSLAGQFSDLQMQELASLFSTNPPDVDGVAHGDFTVVGPLRQPLFSAPRIVVDGATIGDYAFESVTASLDYDAGDPKATWRLGDFTARYGGATITGNARYGQDQSFGLDAHASTVPLTLLQPYVAEYAAVRGVGDVRASVTGFVRDGKAEGLAGTLTATTAGLSINNESVGDLRAVVGLNGDVVTSRALTLGPAAPAQPLVTVSDLRYDRASGAVRVAGALNSLEVDVLRRLLTASPYVVNNPGSAAAGWLKPITNPFSGTLDATFAVGGTTADPNARVTWTGRDMVIEKQAIQTFTGDATLDRQAISLAEATLKADEASVTAHGRVVLDRSLSGELQANNLPLAIVRRWFPGAPALAGLTGTADLIYIEAAGAPSAPNLTLSAELSKINWQSQDVLAGRSFAIDRVSVSQARIREGQISADDVRVTMLGAAGAGRPAKGAPAASPTRYQISASGDMEFHWAAPYIPEDPQVNLAVAIHDQGLGILTAFAPTTDMEMGGTVSGAFTWKGTLREPRLNGNLTVAQTPGQRIRYGAMTTALAGLNGSFTFTGDTMQVNSFTARTEIINPRDNTVVRTSDPITLVGDLALHDGVPGVHAIRLKAPRLRVAEAPLPGLNSGRLLADSLSADLSIGGTLPRPAIGGTVNIANTDFRLPDTLASGGQAPLLPILPRFNIAVSVGSNVRVSTSVLSSYVHTVPGEPIQITGTALRPSLVGTMVVDRGTLAFPTARFAIQSGGTVTLRYPTIPVTTLASGAQDEPALAINVDVTATTQVTAASVNGQMRRYTITVEARGPINTSAPLQITDPNSFANTPYGERGLQLTFRSDPPDLAYSPAGLQERVTGLLGGQQAIEGLFSRNPDVGRILSQQLTDVLSASFLPGLLDKLGLGHALGFEELSVDYNRVDAFTLRVSRQLLGPIYASYWQRLSGAPSRSGGLDNPAWEFKLSYRFRPDLQFSWTTDDQRTNAYLLEGVFRF